MNCAKYAAGEAGAHFGIIGSYNWVGTTSDDLVLYDLWPQGGSIGFRLGYDHQFANNVVVGILADASLAGISGAQIDFTNIGGTVIVTGSQATLQAHGSVRGRLGIAIDRFMPYATGGIAWARHEVDYRQELGFPGFETNINGAQTHVGWTLGAGAEFAMTDALAVSAEYRYSDYGSKTYSGDFIGLPLESDIWLESHSLTRRKFVSDLFQRAKSAQSAIAMAERLAPSKAGVVAFYQEVDIIGGRSIAHVAQRAAAP